MLSFQHIRQNNLILNNYFIIFILIVITFLRIVSLYFSPIELSVDEAQYWHWSQKLEWGYFTKPPIIAWAISLSTNLFGNEEWAVRLCSPIIHFFFSIISWTTSQSIFVNSAVRIAALIWIFTPI